MLHHLRAIRNFSLSRNGLTTWRIARSRSPRRNAQTQLALPSGPQMMALPAPSAPAQGQKGGKGNRKRGGLGPYAAKSQATKNFDFLVKLPLEFRANFHEKFHKNEICYKFQKNRCNRSDKCKFLSGAAVRSLTTTANASPQKSTEPHHRLSLTKFKQFLLPYPFPQLPPL